MKDNNFKCMIQCAMHTGLTYLMMKPTLQKLFPTIMIGATSSTASSAAEGKHRTQDRFIYKIECLRALKVRQSSGRCLPRSVEQDQVP